MNVALAQTLYDEFPELYRGRVKPASDSSMCWGFQCGDGWFALLRELSMHLTDYAREKTNFHLEAVEIKAKAGYLRFELVFGTDWTEACIEAGHRRARETCEATGKPGALCRPARGFRHGWAYRVLCDEKANELGYSKVTRDSSPSN